MKKTTRFNRRAFSGLAVLLCLMLGGCLGGPQVAAPEAPAESFPVLVRADGAVLSALEFRTYVKAYDYIIVGEQHDNPAHHRAQADLLRETRAAQREPALALEMLAYEINPILAGLDHSIHPRSQLDSFIDWKTLWGFSFELYRDVFLAADARPNAPEGEYGLPVRGLNLPGRITKAVGRGGLDAIADEDRALLPLTIQPMPQAQANHLAAMREAHRGMPGKPGHPKPPTTPMISQDNFNLVMRLWDTTMAWQMVQTAFDLDRPVFALMGVGHVMYGWSVPSKIEHYDVSGQVLTIVPVEGHYENTVTGETVTRKAFQEATPGSAPTIRLVPNEPLPVGDLLDESSQLFIVAPPVPQRPRLGLLMDGGKEATAGPTGLRVKEVLRGSPADLAGFLPGDVIKQENGQPIREMRDMHEAAIRNLELGRGFVFSIDRQGKKITLEVPLQR